MTPADRTGAIREPAAGGRRRPTALPRPLGSLAPLRARIKVPINRRPRPYGHVSLPRMRQRLKPKNTNLPAGIYTIEPDAATRTTEGGLDAARLVLDGARSARRLLQRLVPALLAARVEPAL